MKRQITAWLGTTVLALGIATGAAFAGPASAADIPGSSAANPIVVANATDVPVGAVEDEVSTYLTDAKCDTTRSWVLTEPGEDEVSHLERQFKREVPAQAEVSHQEWNIEGRSREITPATGEVSHQEYRYERKVKECQPTVEYQWEKHVRGTTEVKDSRGRWVAGPAFDWRDYPGAGPVWADGGSGGHNSTWVEGGVRYTSTHFKYVQTGKTRPGKDVCEWKTETSDWLTEAPAGEGWKQIDQRKVVDVEAKPEVVGPWSDWTRINRAPYLAEPTAPENTRTHEYRVVGPIKVVDSEAVPAFTEYYTGADSKPSRNVEDAAWVRDAALEGWTQFGERKVVDSEATPDVVTYFAYTDGKACETSTPTPTTTPTTPETSSSTTSPSPAGTSVSTRAGRTELAATGASSTGLYLGFAAVLLALGAAMVLGTRRRGTHV